MDKIIVSITGLFSIVGIYWFFFGKKDKAVEVSETQTIQVDGGYKPNLIKIKPGQPINLTFIRKDTNSCLEEIVLADYKIKEFLPLNQPVTITLNPPHPKTSDFHCSMNMFRGQIVTE